MLLQSTEKLSYTWSFGWYENEIILFELLHQIIQQAYQPEQRIKLGPPMSYFNPAIGKII